MVKTTVYLPLELKRRIERAAREQQRSEADVIREALDTAVARPRPRLPLFRSTGETDVAERVDELLAEGFGRD